jgi:hypothetical protein
MPASFPKDPVAVGRLNDLEKASLRRTVKSNRIQKLQINKTL